MTLYSLLAEDKSPTFESHLKEQTPDWSRFDQNQDQDQRGLAPLSAQVFVVLTVSALKMSK